MRGDIVRVTSTRPSSSGLRPPAVTVCAIGPGAEGWKKEGDCHNKTSMADLRQCFKNNQFSLNETIAGVYQRNSHETKPVKAIWKSSMSTHFLGVCHTLVYEEALSSTDILLIGLRGKPRNYMVYLHDPTFFLQKSDSYFIPFVFLSKPNGKQYKIVTSRNTRMNQPGENECNKDSDYNFNTCVTNSLATKLGCTFPWATELSTENFQICNTTEKVYEYFGVYLNMYDDTQQYILDLTGCQVPYSYNHYSVVGKPITFEMINIIYFSLSFASTDLTEIQEV